MENATVTLDSSIASKKYDTMQCYITKQNNVEKKQIFPFQVSFYHYH